MPRWHSSSCYYHPPASSSSTPKVHRPALARPYMKRSSPTPAPPFIMPKRPPPSVPGWIALGISTRGVGRPNTDAMAGDGSVAVIGIVESASVKKFDLYNWGVTEMIGSKQTLTGASIVKSETEIIMKFDKLLVEGGEASLADPANYFLHARYEGDSIGYHSENCNCILYFLKSTLLYLRKVLV